MQAIIKAMVLAGALGMASSAMAQDFPNKTVTVVIPFSPGASNDIFGRYLADGLSKLWKRPVVVENRPGAGGALGAAVVAKAKPDGYTLLFSSSSYTTNAAVEANMPFDPQKDLKPVGIAALGQMIVVTGTRMPLPTLGEVVKQAKAQKIFYGTSGAGSSSTFSAELINDVAGIRMETVNYKGGSEALIDLVGGRIDVYVGSVTTVLPGIQAKQLKAVAVQSKIRSAALPDVPTVAEAGFAGAESDVWWGVFAPTGTPADVLNKINEGIAMVMGTPDAKEFLAKQGGIPPEKTSVEEFSKQVMNELVQWRDLAKKHNISAK